MTASAEAANILRAANDLRLSMRTEFVPFSRSRSACGKTAPYRFQDLSLNWRVTLLKDGREILTTDYSAGITHCPSYSHRITTDVDAAVRFECENGTKARIRFGAPAAGGAPIVPHLQDVLYGLMTDASAIDAGDFETWAYDLGFNPDSRAAEKMYNACVEIGLKLRRALGNDGLERLRTACEGY